MNRSASFKSPKDATESGWWFIFSGNKLLVKDESFSVPFLEDPSSFDLVVMRKRVVGELDGACCYSAEVDAGAVPPGGTSFHGLRALFARIDDRFFRFAGRSFQIMNWDRTHQFCSQCGHAARDKEDELAKICPACGFVSFPVMAPAMIVAVTRNEKILLARAGRFPMEMYSVLAGFVEPGESLEDCVRREVVEEVGVKVKNIRYFGSQAWPFPNSLMIAFTAEYGSGEIRVDEKEIVDAAWFEAGNLPKIPDKISIARRLIDWFVEEMTGHR